MRKTIAFIELYQHEEVLRHYCDLLKDSNYRVNIYCSQLVYNALAAFWDIDNFNWIIKSGDTEISSFLQRHHKEISSVHLVFICTALNAFKSFYELVVKSNAVLLVHNAHSFLAPDKYIWLNNREPIKDRLRLLKVYGARAHYYKAELQKKLKGLIFPSEVILNYVHNSFTLPDHLKLDSLPFVYYKTALRKLQPQINITLPCTIDSNLRNYDEVATALRQISGKLKFPVQIILLGTVRDPDANIIQMFENLVTEKLRVKTFEQYIPSSTYEAYLHQSHFLILPLKEKVRNHIYQEWMGYSKLSGGINDMIRTGTPTLIPEHYPIEENLSGLVHQYAAKDLAGILLEWINNLDQVDLMSKNNEGLKSRTRQIMKTHLLDYLKSMI